MAMLDVHPNTGACAMISIVIHSPTVVTVTHSPSFLARWLLGHQETTREAFDSGLHGWIYRHDDRSVEAHVEAQIERAITRRAVEQRFESRVRR
jgi:hypothetical protein